MKKELNIQHSTFKTENSTLNIQNSTFKTENSTFNTPLKTHLPALFKGSGIIAMFSVMMV